jgi:F-type H+-transporting ATPase subunit delta
MAVFVARYACAFADVATQEKLDAAAIERQMDDFIATWNGSAELRELFVNPAVAAVQKVAVLDMLNVKLEACRRSCATCWRC